MAKTNVKVKLIGTDGNVFALIGKVTAALKRKGHDDLAKECSEKIFASESYNAALRVMMEYVEVS